MKGRSLALVLTGVAFAVHGIKLMAWGYGKYDGYLGRENGLAFVIIGSLVAIVGVIFQLKRESIETV